MQQEFHCAVDARKKKGASRNLLHSRCVMHQGCKQGFAVQKMTDARMVQVGIRCAVDAQSIEAASRESQCSRYLMHQGCKQGFTVQYMPDASRVQTGI